jgi:hypothetical protein
MPGRRSPSAHSSPASASVRAALEGDVVHYVYADPLVCSCLYVGNQAAYNQFKQDRQQQNLVDAQQMEAQAYSDAAWNWTAWGPWGPQYGFVYGTEFGW